MRPWEKYLQLSGQIPGWTRGQEAEALAERAYSLPRGAVIVEIGSFFGSGSVLLAGARKARRSGKVHCVDPFDCSGDEFSIPHYHAIMAAFAGLTLRERFDENIRQCGLTDWVDAHPGTAAEVAAGWDRPVDLLYLDGDQSPAGARAAYDAWAPWLKSGGTLALHNSASRDYTPGHEGHFLLAEEFARGPDYADAEVVGSTTFAVRR